MAAQPSLLDIRLDPARTPFLARVEQHWRAVIDGEGDRDIHLAIRALSDGAGFSPELATRVFEHITAGSEDEMSVAALLARTAPDRLSGATIAACASVLRSRAHRIHPRVDGPLADTCGTGGDGFKTLNVSTAAALVLVSGGVFVAKHGNRAITSACGSADVLEAMGVPIDAEPRAVERVIEEAHVGFMFAPRFHPAMRFVQPVRRQLAAEGTALGISVRTVFNVLGPLTNPAETPHQLVGVYAAELVEPVAHALRALGLERALVVHGSGPGGEPMDELSPFGPTLIAVLTSDGTIRRFDVEPPDLGLHSVDPARVASSGSAVESAVRIRAILGGADDPARELIALNAGAALWIAGRAADLRTGLTDARDLLRSGRPLACLENLVAAANRLPT